MWDFIKETAKKALPVMVGVLAAGAVYKLSEKYLPVLRDKI